MAKRTITKILLELEHDGPACHLDTLVSFYAKVTKHKYTVVETETIELGVDKKKSENTKAVNELKRLVAACMETVGYNQVSSKSIDNKRTERFCGRPTTNCNEYCVAGRFDDTSHGHQTSGRAVADIEFYTTDASKLRHARVMVNDGQLMVDDGPYGDWKNGTSIHLANPNVFTLIGQAIVAQKE